MQSYKCCSQALRADELERATQLVMVAWAQDSIVLPALMGRYACAYVWVVIGNW